MRGQPRWEGSEPVVSTDAAQANARGPAPSVDGTAGRRR
jgi:hypothetical protein